MYGYLKRLAATGAAYQVSDALSKLLALGTLPLYTRHLSRAGYGTAEVLITLVILVSIVVRLGIGEAFVRFHFHDSDDAARRRVARAATGFLVLTTTAVSVPAALAAGPLSELILGHTDAGLMRVTVLGLWSFTNLELAYALLRVEERAREYLTASLLNVVLTVGLTVWLVVVREDGARGLLLGNFAASTVVLLGLWWSQRDRLGLLTDSGARGELGAMLRFGLPTVPAEVSVFALNFVDRLYIYHASSRAAAGLYALSVKLAAVVVMVVRAFQYAWPPLAYSIRDDREAARVYAVITTYYVLVTGAVVAAATLLGRWVLRVFAAPSFYPAHEALPWVALGWALYGLFLVLVVSAGRANVTTRNFPAALAGLVVNVVLLLVLVGPLGIAGAGIALCGAYVVMLAVMYALTRELFPVPFQWARLAHLVAVIGGVSVAGELLLPTAGAAGLLSRCAALAAIPVLLVATGFLRPEERVRLAELWTRARRRESPERPEPRPQALP
jgi:O-antigen/teichoic acid export membrane protein